MTRKMLPIGIQTFRKIREDNCYYVDKTGFACRLAEAGGNPQLVCIFEFKVMEESPAGRALEQIKARNYAAKYRALGQPMHLIGIEFSRQSRTVTGFEVELL